MEMEEQGLVSDEELAQMWLELGDEAMKISEDIEEVEREGEVVISSESEPEAEGEVRVLRLRGGGEEEDEK